DPRELEYRGGGPFAGGFPVTPLYKRVVIHELFHRRGPGPPVGGAPSAGPGCDGHPLRRQERFKEGNPPLFGGERHQGPFRAEERRAIDAHSPWTRRLEERRTTRAGEPIDLVPYVLRHRERFVLKPNDDYGGKGVVLGWAVGEAEWGQAVAAGLRTPYVVQERVSLPREPYPALVDGKLQWSERMLDTAPFVCHGEYMDGCLTRISTAALLNVTAGGGSTVPTFVAEPRA